MQKNKTKRKQNIEQINQQSSPRNYSMSGYWGYANKQNGWPDDYIDFSGGMLGL